MTISLDKRLKLCYNGTTMMKLSEGEKVTVVDLGPSYPNMQFRGIIRGISVDGPARIYIVEMVDKIDLLNYVYSHCTMPEACIKLGWN